MSFVCVWMHERRRTFRHCFVIVALSGCHMGQSLIAHFTIRYIVPTKTPAEAPKGALFGGLRTCSGCRSRC